MNANAWDVDDLDDDDWDDEDWELDSAAADARYMSNAANDDIMTNGQRVRDLRMMIDMEPESLADYAMINVKDLLAIEAGSLPLERGLAQLLADGLGVSLSEVWIEQDAAA